MSATTSARSAAPVAKEMSFLDRWLAVWIVAAMAAGHDRPLAHRRTL